MKPEYLVGLGQDSHTFVDESEQKKLVLGGVEFDHIGLNGNSDADVILHAIFNAISQCIGGKSIGHYSDPMCLQKGITDSREYLKIAMMMMDKHGYRVSNISISLECKTPKVDPISDEIKSSVASILKTDKTQVGITATTGETLTKFGLGIGIQCLVNILLVKKPTPFYKKPKFIITFIVIVAYLYGFYYAINHLDFL